MKLKNLAGAFLALAGISFAGSAFAGFSTNRIWEVIQESPSGSYKATETISIRMRLVSPNWNTPEGVTKLQWTVAPGPDYPPLAAGMGGDVLVPPLSIGVVASGKTYGAPLDTENHGAGWKSANNGRFTDFYFLYTVKTGDVALPLRLAADGSGNPIGGGKWKPDGDPTGTKFFFKNGPGDFGNEVWQIVAQDGTKLEPELMSNEPADHNVSGLYTDTDGHTWQPAKFAACDYLYDFRYYLETMRFAADASEDAWRSVHESSTELEAGSPNPRIESVDGIELTGDEGRNFALYAWVAPLDTDPDPKNWDWAAPADYAVRLDSLASGEKAKVVSFTDPDGVTRDHYVLTIDNWTGASYKDFRIYGLHDGRQARVVLSGTPHWNYDTAGALVGASEGRYDFSAKTVRCIEPTPPAVKVGIDGDFSNLFKYNCATTPYSLAQQLNLQLNTPTNATIKVKLTFALGDSSDFPTNVIAISRDETTGFRRESLLNPMEVTIPPNDTIPRKADKTTEDKVFLYVLGATADTVLDKGGIKITATPVVLEGTTEIADCGYASNTVVVTVNGMEPVATAVNDTPLSDEAPTALTPIRGGGNLSCTVKLEDSYRNLALLDETKGSNGFYTVSFNRGYGSPLTITNNATGGLLVPVDYNDGYAYLKFAVPYTTVTNAYSASFKITNPEGKPSKTYNLVVTTIPPPVVKATVPDGKVTPDGFFELMESDTAKSTVRFELSDILEADGQALWAFLEPANAAASNRTDGAFFTVRPNAAAGATRIGVEIDTMGTGTGSTAHDYDFGGIQILDGDGSGAGDGSLAKFNVVLCTQSAYAADKVFRGYDGSTAKLTILLDNHEPELKQLVLSEVIKAEGSATTNTVDVLTASGKTAANRVHKGNDVIVNPMTIADWKDVSRDINATNENLMVTRWLIYRINDSGAKERWDAYYTYGPNEKLVVPGGLTVYNDKETTYLFEVQIQDKDMRALGTAGLIEDEDEPSGWAYRIYKDLPGFEPDWAGDDESNVWGPAFTFTVLANAKPNVDISVREQGSTDVQGVRAFTEDQLTPLNNKIYNDDDMRLVVSLAEQYDRKTEVKVKLTLTPADNMNVNGGFVTQETYMVSFVGANRSTEVRITDFDATYRDGKVQRGYAKYQVTAEVVEPTAAAEKYNATTCQFFVVNRPPRLELGAGSQQFSEYVDNPDLAYDVAKNDIQTVDWSATDIYWDLTNISVKATISGGKILDGDGVEYTTYTYSATNSAVVATNYEDGAYNVAFKFKFSNSGTNTITFVATDKDGDSSERHVLRFAIPETKTLLLYPAKPTQPSTDSDDIADYFSAAGIGYGRVWADGDTKLSAIDKWIHDWTCSQGGVAKVYAMGYLANEREDMTSYAFVSAKGDHDTSQTGYAPADENDKLKYLDSFFYRWFAKLVAESGSDSNWTAYKPVPQVSTNRDTVAAGTVMSMSFPKKTGMNDREYNDISALAIFSRELLWSDNMGDINGDGVPDSYVVKYKLVEEFAGGNDLNDVNFSEDGKTPYCQDYLPLGELLPYSKLIPGITSYDNIKNAMAFTPRLKIRGYDETDVQSLARRRATYGVIAETIPGVSALNDAADMAGIDGAKPDRKYVNPREDADSTLNYVEWLAWSEYAAANLPEGAVTNKAYFSLWSPERPTDPTKADTDNDGFTDGYEYYYWYRAHVGYIENGVHRYLTGRRYDPRNPGEGTFISSDDIAGWMDPLVSSGGDKTRDSDNDGLPDLIEFEIGTNPFDFDTDGDGLPDGFEIMLGGTDPLLAETTKGISDAMRNFDGDAMAFTTPFLDANEFVLPTPLVVNSFVKFALVDPDGDTDGIQWYVSKYFLDPSNVVASAETKSGITFTRADDADVTYVTSLDRLPVVDGHLACDLLKTQVRTMIATNDEFGVEGDVNVALMPVMIPAGTPVTNVSETAVEYRTLRFKEDVTGVNAAWVYGRSVSGVTTGDAKANLGGFGMLAIARYQDAKAGFELAALPAQDDGVAYLHHFVYQEFGFDPRTAWNANTPLAPRWGKTVKTGEGETASTESVANNYTEDYGYAGVAARTREFTLYDEFLVLSFFLNNGKLDLGDVTPTQAMPWEKIWSKYTTNGQGPNEPNWEEDNDHFKGRTAETNSGTNGADTDMDGVPDGWELYVMAGPKVEDKETKELRYNLVAPYNDGFYSSFGPFVGDAANASMTDNNATGGRSSTGGDADGLTELQEYAGTDSCAYYCEPWGGNAAAFSTTIVRPAEHKDWLNKFFPTDPWNKDTDGDGLGDNEISGKAARFKYGKPVDDGKMIAIPGGGLNPCTVDTDRDGLPDPWEAQFAGQTVYAGEDAQRPKDKDGNEVADGNVLQGLCDGMDGTVWDAYNSPRIKNAEEDYVVSYAVNGGTAAQVVDRDYDKDGLENWQEYMTGAMRVWRYDDPVTGWSYIPDDLYWTKDPETGEYVFSPDLGALAKRTGEKIGSEAEFWYKTFFDTKSKLYNPHFVTGTSPSSQYFSRVTNGWDMVFTEQGTYYMFYDRVNDSDLKNDWGKAYYSMPVAPSKYICTSPIVADTDKDGMDDGYELFHGMNPILGAPGVLLDSNGPCDVVYDAWYKKQTGSPVNPLDNVWMNNPKGYGKYDFVAHPWLNGIVDVDPDGDDIRNQDEAIMPLVAPSTVWLHTDPTPLWMTDSSYGDSLVNRFFRLPIALGIVPVPDAFVYGGKEYSLVDRDGFTWGKTMAEPPQYIMPFVPDFWQLSAVGAANWMYSFEENEGYDTDHDSGSDYEELQGKFRNKTDPQDADSPRRRQAMHFGGPEDPSALQTMPFVGEGYPRAAMGYPDDMSFLQYTVECWVKPESAADATVLERTSFTDPSHVADERYVRRNFAIMIRNGKWCTAFDSNGTMSNSVVEVIGKTDAAVGEWTHVAATYDANRLTLYVNGGEDGYVLSNLKPEYGSSAVVVYPAGSGSAKTNDLVDTSSGSLEALKGTAHAYWFDNEYTLNAFLIGASFANAKDGNHLDVTQGKGWTRYRDFFKGYVDEIRVWDGAQPADVIESNFSSRKRYTREDALENRSSFYNQWSTGKLRYRKDGDGQDLDVMPELRFHWAFDSIPGAENAEAVAQAPHGFLRGDKPFYSRPQGYEIPWWSVIVDAYGSVYEGERNWVPWIPNTVTHLPRFDLTTLDSYYWSENYAGDEAGTYKFARTAEPVSKWTQMVRNMTEKSLEFRTTGRRFWLSHNTGTNAASTLDRQFEFTGRHLNQTGDDLLPLGGAFVKYVDSMWDDQGASSVWEQTLVDGDGDGLADWWQEYAEQNYREGVPEGETITWDTMIWYEVGGVKIRMTAGEAYKRDLAKGVYVDANGEVQVGPTAYAQTAKSDGMIPDWWKELKKIDGEEPFSDLDNDGLNNYVEYVASELLPFQLNLDPRMAKSDTKTLDYFRRIGKLYLGEMLTDHDQMEDHWERSLGDESVASAALWDALKDADEDGTGDGWTNFAENRYNGYAMSTLAQLVAHAMGDNEVLDAPIPSIRMKVRYNGDRPLILKSQTGNGDNIDDAGEFKTPALIVTAFSKNADTGSYVLKPDAIWTIRPGVPVEKEVYLGGWENRVVRGTMAPGNVDIGTLDIKFAQVPQSDLYSWTDESGTHLSGTYKEFREALDKNPDIIQNIQNFEWLSLYAPVNEYTSSDRAVTVTRDALTQKGYIAVYGERVGTINLTTGDFEFDMAAMNRLRVNYTYDGGKGPAAAWSYKEAIFKITYTATVPSTQLSSLDFSLAKSDPNIITPDGSLVKASFVRGGLNSFQAFYDLDNSGTWDPGEPFGVVNDVEIGWAGRDVEIEISDMSAVTPRVKLWGAGGGESSGGNGGGQPTGEATAGASAADSDRGTRVGVETFSDVSNRFEITTAPAPKSRVRIVRYKVDNFPVYKVGVDAGVVLEKDFEQTSRDFLHEGDFLVDGDLDIDWKNLYTDVVTWWGAQLAACEVTNVTYLIVYNWDAASYRTDDDTNTQVKANATLVTRRFEVTRSVPTPCPERAVYNQSRPTFAWRIDNEDKWASWFGTTYTAFKVRVKDESGKNLVYDSGIRRLPAKDSQGVYTWTAPLYVGEKVPGTGVTFSNLTKYTWEVAVYNAKFSTDTLYAMEMDDPTGKKVFSAAETFRMNVTDLDASSSALAVRVCYTGPATKLAGRVRAEAFTSPDFSGDPVAAVTLDDASVLSPSGTVANAGMIGLPAGKYFIRAYVDTNQNGVHDDWESWGYLSERDLASKPGIFNPVALEASVNPSAANVRKVLIEDCDTDGDWFPDVWEAEQNGDRFDRTKIAPVKGDAELIGVNPELKSILKASDFPMLKALGSVDGFSLLTGFKPAQVKTTVAANGMSRFSVDNKVDSVTISKLEFDADGNVVIRLDAKTTVGAVDPAAAAIYDLDLSKTVICRIYRKTDLASAGWGNPVAEETVTVGAGPVTIEIAGEKAAQAFYRAEIIEK